MSTLHAMLHEYTGWAYCVNMNLNIKIHRKTKMNGTNKFSNVLKNRIYSVFVFFVIL
jgi:hypothetical protein